MLARWPRARDRELQDAVVEVCVFEASRRDELLEPFARADEDTVTALTQAKPEGDKRLDVASCPEREKDDSHTTSLALG